jgi:cytochrome c-type biogenesis protein CcmH/NrfG
MTSGRVSVREQDLPSVANIMMPVDEALGVVSHQLAFSDGSNAGIEVDAETMPPQEPEVDQHATVRPGQEDPIDFDDARTMSPPRFKQRRAVKAANGPAPFPEEEVPTNKVARMLGRVDTKPHRIPQARGATDAPASTQHVDHGVARSKKATQMGLAPAFQTLPDEALEELTASEPPAPTPPPPPPPQFQASTRPPMFEEPDDLEPLATALEGATIVAPAPESRGIPAWIQGMLLVMLVTGVGVAGWMLWSQSGELELAADDPGKGPITGTVNGLEPKEAAEAAPEPSNRQATAERDRAREPAADAPQPEAKRAPEPDLAEAATATPLAAEPEPAEPATVDSPAAEPSKPEAAAAPEVAVAKPEAGEGARPVVPTQGLPRDPAKASDVLVHRALPLIRQGKLGQAEATLDRAWELDPKNPQAMAGYARLYLAKKDGDQALVWARRAVRRRSKRAPYHVLYGDALALQGKTTEARNAYRRALAIDPKNRTARSRLAASGARAAK